MNKRSARHGSGPGKRPGSARESYAPKAGAPGGMDEKFAEALKTTPGLAEAYIKVTQRAYDKRVKRGVFSTEEQRVVKAALDAFHAQLRDVILRKKLSTLARELIDGKAMARNMLVEMQQTFSRWTRLKEIESMLEQQPEEMRGDFELLIEQVRFDLAVRMERVLVKLHGAEEARAMMGLKEGDKTFAQMRQEARRVQSSRSRGVKRRS